MGQLPQYFKLCRRIALHANIESMGIATVNRSSCETTADNLWIGRGLLVATPKRDLICKDGFGEVKFGLELAV